jgi:transcriptional regulator with XRE-family HTH domain
VEGAQIMYEIFDELIKQKGLSAYKVAKDTGISQTTLSDWNLKSIYNDGLFANAERIRKCGFMGFSREAAFFLPF